MFKLTIGLMVLFILSNPITAMQNPDEPEDGNNSRKSLSISSGVQADSEANYLPILAKNPQYQMLFNITYAFHDFWEQNLETYSRLEYCKNQVVPVFQRNIQSAISLIAMVDSLDSGRISLDNFLFQVLNIRLDLLERRAKMFECSQEHVKKFGRLPIPYFIPTDPRKVDHLTAEDKLFSQNATEQYQFFNLLIYSIYKLADPYSLSCKTKHLISCSRTLWPILNDETEDLSYPDFAVITQDYDPVEYQQHKDYDYYRDNLEKVDYEVTLMNWCRERSKIKLTRAEIVQNWGKKYDALKLAPQPSWLYREVSIPQEDITIKPSPNLEMVSSSKSVGASKNKKSKKESGTSRRSDRLKGQTKGKVVDAQMSRASTENVVMGAIESPPSSTIEELDQISEVSKIEVRDNIADISNTPILQDEEESTEEDQVEPMPQIAAIKTVEPRKASVGVPSGFRKYHPETMISDHRDELEDPLPKIGNTHQKLIDCIFDYHCHGQGFNFGQFRSLWEHINGEGSVRKSGSGSSHYALLNRYGKVVMGTFAHGDGQEYNKKTVRYLRAALNAVGIYE